MFGDYWYRKQVANPSLVVDDEAKVTMTLAQFRKELEKAFLAGKVEGKQDGGLKPGLFDDLLGGLGK